jgi:serine/threonine protein kinase
MDARYYDFCGADPFFYDDATPRTSEDYVHSLPPLPAEWSEHERTIWRVLTPVTHSMPPQGWKIHVSAQVSTADRVLRTVEAYCTENRVPWKHLRSPSILRSRNAKYAPRSGSGKAVTIYPADDRQFERTLADLDAALCGLPGPYILSDLRYGQGPLYVRYGAFLTRWMDKEGQRVPAIRRPDGVLVPDLRQPTLHIPSWVQIPACLTPHLEARTAEATDFPYEVTGALHFSNGGGVYTAHAAGDATTPVILKEARPYAGLDSDGIDALTRLRREHEMLTHLAGIGGVPKPYELFTSWEHHYLAMEQRAGSPLGGWMARNYPMIGVGADTTDVAAYAVRARWIVQQVEQILQAIHSRGVVFGDLHTRNILVDEGDQVSLVDYEVSFRLTERETAALGAPGFRPGPDRTGTDIDLYALAALRLWIFLPLVSMLELAPAKLDAYLAYIDQRFPLDSDYTSAIRSELVPRGATPPTSLTSEIDTTAPDWPTVCHDIAAAVVASATPQRHDRLFPGDIEQFTSGGATFAYGAAGVLYALACAGETIDSAHEQWLVEAVHRQPPTRPGFYDGAHGIAYVLDLLGYHDDATALLDYAEPMTASIVAHQLAAGLAGVGLNLLHFGDIRKESRWTLQALAVGTRLADALAHAAPPGREGTAGLLRGWSGAALLFIRLFEHTADARWLNLANDALERDLVECVPVRGHRKLQVRDGGRTLPYLEVGSAGIAVVLNELQTHMPGAPSLQSLPQLTEACCGEFVIHPGLFLGRAGLLLTLTRLRRRHPGPALDAAIARHQSSFALHAVPFGGGVAFPGNQLLRLSMDLGTGGAGILLSLAGTHDPHISLPFLHADGP